MLHWNADISHTRIFAHYAENLVNINAEFQKISRLDRHSKLQNRFSLPVYSASHLCNHTKFNRHSPKSWATTKCFLTMYRHKAAYRDHNFALVAAWNISRLWPAASKCMALAVPARILFASIGEILLLVAMNFSSSASQWPWEFIRAWVRYFRLEFMFENSSSSLRILFWLGEHWQF